MSLSSQSGRSTSFYLGSNGVQITATAVGSDCDLVGNYTFAIQSRLVAAPNPAASELTVMLTDTASSSANTGIGSVTTNELEAPLALDLYDFFGRKIKNQRSNHGKTIFDVRDLPNGLYELRSGTGKHILSERIQVAH